MLMLQRLTRRSKTQCAALDPGDSFVCFGPGQQQKTFGASDLTQKPSPSAQKCTTAPELMAPASGTPGSLTAGGVVHLFLHSISLDLVPGNAITQISTAYVLSV